MRCFLLTLALVLGISFVGGCTRTGAVHRNGHAVGFIRMALQDPDRRNWSDTASRPLATYVWYPAEPGSKMRTFRIPHDRPVFIGGDAAMDAEFLGRDKRYPLILMSHGTGGSGMQMMWLGRQLAKRGFVAVAVDHHGNTAAEARYDPRGFRLPGERALDLTAVTDIILSNPELGSRIDAGRIGMVGYSLGGHTAVALAGGVTDLERFSEFCSSDKRDATCDPQPEYPEAEEEFRRLVSGDAKSLSLLAQQSESFRDERFSSFVVLAPALIQAFSQESLQAIEAPFLIVSGTSDSVAPAPTNADRLAGLLPQARQWDLSGAHHYVFLNACNLRGRVFVPVCRDPAGGSRERLHSQIGEAVAEFFVSTMGNV